MFRVKFLIKKFYQARMDVKEFFVRHGVWEKKTLDCSNFIWDDLVELELLPGTAMHLIPWTVEGLCLQILLSLRPSHSANPKLQDCRQKKFAKPTNTHQNLTGVNFGQSFRRNGPKIKRG